MTSNLPLRRTLLSAFGALFLASTFVAAAVAPATDTPAARILA